MKHDILRSAWLTPAVSAFSVLRLVVDNRPERHVIVSVVDLTRFHVILLLDL